MDSRAEVAEIGVTAFTAQTKAHHVPGRLVVRRIPDLNPSAAHGQDGLCNTWRFHAFFNTTAPDVADTGAADKTHRAHAIIENVNANLRNFALAHLPSGKLAANAAWLVLAVIAFNLTRAAALTGPQLARATTATIRRTLVTVPAPPVSSARRLRLHLLTNWPWQQARKRLFATVGGPPYRPRPDHQRRRRHDPRNPEEPTVDHPDIEFGRAPTRTPEIPSPTRGGLLTQAHRWIEA